MDSKYGYIVRVVNAQGQDCWLSQRVYMSYDSVLTVKHNMQDTRRYSRVYVMAATQEQHDSALSIVE